MKVKAHVEKDWNTWVLAPDRAPREVPVVEIPDEFYKRWQEAWDRMEAVQREITFWFEDHAPDLVVIGEAPYAGTR